jgi:hypothetical protein
MHLWRLIASGVLAAMALTASLAASGAVIYKWTDADGVVHYSDQPVAGAQKLVTGATPSLTTVPAPPILPPSAAATVKRKPDSHTLTIDSPTAEATYFAGPVSVRAHLAPELGPGQAVNWTLNGQPVEQPPDALEFALTELGRGAYTLNVSLSETDTHDVLAAATVTFYVKQPTIFSPAHK